MSYVCDSCGSPAEPHYDSPELGDQGAFDVVCTECGWEMYIPAEATARTRIGKLRKIDQEKMAARVEGYLVDIITASLLVKVYEALSKENREKFGQVSLPKLVDLGWKVAK